MEKLILNFDWSNPPFWTNLPLTNVQVSTVYVSLYYYNGKLSHMACLTRRVDNVLISVWNLRAEPGRLGQHGPARPGGIFGPSRPGPARENFETESARKNFRPESARPGPGEFWDRVGPARPGRILNSNRPGPARGIFLKILYHCIVSHVD